MAKGSKGHQRIVSAKGKSTPYALRSRSAKILKKEVKPAVKCSKPPVKNDWEDAACPICMDCPHNAVLLLCSSHEKGCRPYMCDTAYQLSNCLDQYKKATPTMADLSCPLCRGEVRGWTVVKPAREFLDAQKRSCMQDNCSFSGAFKELKKHMKKVHPFAKPWEVDPKIQQEWRRMEHERERNDVISTIRATTPGAIVMGDYVIERGSGSPSFGPNAGVFPIESLMDALFRVHSSEETRGMSLTARLERFQLHAQEHERPQSFFRTSFSEDFLHEEYLHHIQAGAADVADGLHLQEMNIIPEILDKGVVDQVASKFLEYAPPEGTFPDNVERKNLNPYSSACRELFEVGEKCHSFCSSSKSGDIDFQTSILDSSPQIKDELISVAMKSPFLQPKFISPTGTLESTPENQSCSESLDGNGHHRCAEKTNDLPSLDYGDCGNNKDNKYNELVNVEAEVSESNGEKDINQRPESMPWGSPLLKSVVGGSAAVIGVVFLFLRVRQGNERGRASGGRGNRLPT